MPKPKPDLPKFPLIRDIQPVSVNLQAGKYFWCACGRSQKHPFCDGSHYGTDIKPVRFLIEQERQVFLCSCKTTRTPPFCDGSHAHLKEEDKGKLTSEL